MVTPAALGELIVEEYIRRLNAEYGFGLTDEEIEIIARQAEETQRMCQIFHDVDLTHVMPILKVDTVRGQK